MIGHRPFLSLGAVRRDRCDTRLHFRFDECGRADHAPLGALYVWNDEELAPHSGFELHAHRDVEIVTWVRSGAITYEDDAGNRARLVADSVQAMSAGAAIHHAERNEENVPARLFQIWLPQGNHETDPEQRSMANSGQTTARRRRQKRPGSRRLAIEGNQLF